MADKNHSVDPGHIREEASVENDAEPNSSEETGMKYEEPNSGDTTLDVHTHVAENLEHHDGDLADAVAALSGIAWDIHIKGDTIAEDAPNLPLSGTGKDGAVGHLSTSVHSIGKESKSAVEADVLALDPTIMVRPHRSGPNPVHNLYWTTSNKAIDRHSIRVDGEWTET